MDSFLQDFRYGIRTLLKNPGFTAVAVVTLALGLGVNTAIFSLTDQVLLRLLPVDKPEELVVLRSPGPKTGRVWSDGDSDASMSYPLYKELTEKDSVFTGLLARFAVPLSVSAVAAAGVSEFIDVSAVGSDNVTAPVWGVVKPLTNTFPAVPLTLATSPACESARAAVLAASLRSKSISLSFQLG